MYGYNNGGGEWLWIVIVVFIVLFIAFGYNRGGIGQGPNNICC